MLSIRQKFARPLRAMGEIAAKELGLDHWDIECVIDPSYEDHTAYLVRHRPTGTELYYDSRKA